MNWRMKDKFLQKPKKRKIIKIFKCSNYKKKKIFLNINLKKENLKYLKIKKFNHKISFKINNKNLYHTKKICYNLKNILNGKKIKFLKTNPISK